MLYGIVHNRDIVQHPLLIMRITGLIGFLKLIGKALSLQYYQFSNAIAYKESLYRCYCLQRILKEESIWHP